MRWYWWAAIVVGGYWLYRSNKQGRGPGPWSDGYVYGTPGILEHP